MDDGSRGDHYRSCLAGKIRTSGRKTIAVSFVSMYLLSALKGKAMKKSLP
jgi:hypothetical protein